MNMKIRNCKETDVDKVRRFVDLSKPLDLHTPFTYWVLLRYFGDSCFVIEEENRVIGFISGMASSCEKGVFYVWQIGVAPPYRGKGHADILIQTILGAAKKQRCHSLHITISPENQSSFKAFSRFAEKRCLPMKKIGVLCFFDSLEQREVAEDLYEIKIDLS